MNFEGFAQNDFDSFMIEGLSERMEAIQERIQPKFRAIGEPLTEDLAMMLGNEMHLHIAKHARRTVNPPNDTWLAICNNKRGYKQHPHFQIGLYDDHLFIWLAFIYELPNKHKIASTFLDRMDDIVKTVPNDYVISMDHMKKDKESMEEIDLHAALERFHNVKKAEFLIGRHIASNDPIIKDGQALYEVVIDTFETLLPLYTLSYK
jgi:uncharacterized protein YktB (UPF0637 family)